MSHTARCLHFLTRAIALDARPGYTAAIQRMRLQERARVLAARLIEGRA